MFFKKYFEKELDMRDENFSGIYKWQEMFDEKVKEMDKTIQAVCECITHDRKDINCLIQMIKKIQTNSTKRKK